jgi:hypothetical protein
MAEYALMKLPYGPTKRGRLSFAITEEGSESDARPRVGVRMLVGAVVYAPRPDPSVRITTPVARILIDEPTCVIFETESGSQYRWSCTNALH